MEEAKFLAGLVSQGKSKDFDKAKTRLKFVRTNIQNLGGEVLKAAASDYLGLKGTGTNSTTVTDSYGLMNEEEILAPLLKKSAGSTSTKRKRSSTEGKAGTKSSLGHACSLCDSLGHHKNNCPKAEPLGERYTMKTFHKIRQPVSVIGTVQLKEIDPVVNNDAFGLQIIGQVKLSGEELLPATVVYKCNIVLRDLLIRSGNPCHLKHETLAKWCNYGKSNKKHVFVKTVASTSDGHEV